MSGDDAGYDVHISMKDENDMVQEIRCQTVKNAVMLLRKWIKDAESRGYNDGLNEGLRRGAEVYGYPQHTHCEACMTEGCSHD